MKLRESRRRRREKSKDLESSRRRLLIDRLKLMHLGPREPLRRARDKPEKEKDSNKPRDKESKLISKLLDKSNLLRNNPAWVSKLE